MPRLSLPALALLAACAAPPGAGGGSPTSPNVILIIADDQGHADLSCTGRAADVSTPQLDALAASGVRFEQAYATAPICNASRAAIITGCYQQRFGTVWYGGKGLHEARFVTLAEQLGAAGYRCGYVGKFHYGNRRSAQPDQRSFPLNHGFDEFYGFHGGRKHFLHHRRALEQAFQASRRQHRRKGQSLAQGPMFDGRELRDQEGFSTELFGRRARQFISANREGPFFLHLGFNAVHNFTHQLPAEYLASQGLKGYRDWDPEVEAYYDWYQQGRKPNNPEGRAHYLGQLHYLDTEIGRLLAHLERLGLREDTLIVYIGDNGGSTPIYADNGPLRGSKYTLYEGGLRVPMIVSWPAAIDGGKVLDNVVAGFDLFPTICAAAGVAAPDHLDGLDLLPLLRGEDPERAHRELYWDTGHEIAVRQGRYKLRIGRRDRHARHEMVELELGEFLYDLEADPGETRNLRGEQPERFAQLLAAHAAWRRGLE